MRARQLITTFMAFALLLPSVVGAVSPPTFGFRPAELNDMKRNGANPADVRALLAGMDSYIVQLARRNRVPERAVRGSLTQKIIRTPAVDRTLEKAAAQAEASAKQIVALNAENKALREQISQISDAKLRNSVLTALAAAQTAIDEGRLEDAQRALAEQEPLRLSEATGANEAWLAVVELRANVAKLAGDYHLQSQVAEEAERQLTQQTNQQLWKLKMIKADAHDQMGDLRGDNRELEAATRIYRFEALPLASLRERPYEWGATNQRLGNTLATLGERESGTIRLKEAATAYQEAFKGYISARAISEVVTTQMNLGTVLESIGSRDDDPTLLAQAAAAYNGVLKNTDRVRDPKQWGMLKHNMCNLLERQGTMAQDVDILKSAVTACTDALQVRVRNNDNLDWADTKNSLAKALSPLGLLEGSMVRLEAARAARIEALSEYSQQQTPVRWAMSTCGLSYDNMIIAGARNDHALLADAEALAGKGRNVAAGRNIQVVQFCDGVIGVISDLKSKWKAEPQK